MPFSSARPKKGSKKDGDCADARAFWQESVERMGFRPHEGAQRIGVSPAFLREAIRRGIFRPVRRGRVVLVSGEELRRYVGA